MKLSIEGIDESERNKSDKKNEDFGDLESKYHKNEIVFEFGKTQDFDTYYSEYKKRRFQNKKKGISDVSDVKIEKTIFDSMKMIQNPIESEFSVIK